MPKIMAKFEAPLTNLSRQSEILSTDPRDCGPLNKLRIDAMSKLHTTALYRLPSGLPWRRPLTAVAATCQKLFFALLRLISLRM